MVSLNKNWAHKLEFIVYFQIEIEVCFGLQWVPAGLEIDIQAEI